MRLPSFRLIHDIMGFKAYFSRYHWTSQAGPSIVSMYTHLAAIDQLLALCGRQRDSNGDIDRSLN